LVSGKGRGVHTAYGAYPFPYLNGTRGCIPGGKAAKAREAEIKDGGAVPSLPMSSWHSVELLEDKDVTTKAHILNICFFSSLNFY
jgi:hypothetical protein